MACTKNFLMEKEFSHRDRCGKVSQGMTSNIQKLKLDPVYTLHAVEFAETAPVSGATDLR